MEKKKSNKANLEKMKTLFFVISLGIAFAFINFAFNISSKTSQNKAIISETTIDGDKIPITRPPDENPKPKPQNVKHIIKSIINIIPDDGEIDTTEYYIPEFTDDPSLYSIPEEENDEPIYNPTKKPIFRGGLAALQKYISTHTEYPKLAIQNEIEGTVIVKFEVTKKGGIGKVAVLNENIDDLLKTEAVRVIKTLPNFKPGLQNGKPVNVWYSVPVSFKLY